MASSSSSSSSSTLSTHRRFKYDVFLSFCPSGDEHTFVDHLYADLKLEGVNAYKDDERFKKGKQISDEVIGCIKDSKFSIIVFSRDYLSSSWCLEELAKIMVFHNTTEHKVYTLFYDLEPTEIQKQIGRAFTFNKLKDEAAARKWRKALADAATLDGWKFKSFADGSGSETIKSIVEEISQELHNTYPPPRSGKILIGMETRLQDRESSLAMGLNDVRMTGIKEMEGLNDSKHEYEFMTLREAPRKIPFRGERLELSYHTLEDDYKEIFLDVACFMVGWEKDKAIRLLESRGFHARNGLRVLEQKSLITIHNNGLLGMHHPIKEMGKNIARIMHPNEPYRHSRLWIQEEIADILAYDLGTEATKAIAVDTPVKLNSEIVTKGFGSMKQLRLLHMVSDFSHVKTGKVGESFPDSLQYLGWVGYPHCYLPKTFEANNLVALEMPYSRIVRLWERGERKVLCKLKFLDLSHSKLSDLDLELTPNLEGLHLEECHDMVELHMPVQCLKLRTLELSHSMLRTLDLRQTPNLEVLKVKECHLIETIHFTLESVKLRSVNLSHLKLKSLAVKETPNLETLHIEECHDLEVLLLPVHSLKLRFVILSNLKIKSLVLEETWNNLETLHIEECHDLEVLLLPAHSVKLRFVNLSHLKLKSLDLRTSLRLETLLIKECHDLEDLDMFFNFKQLRLVKLRHLKLESLNICYAENVENLHIEECHDLKSLHMPVKSENLRVVNLRHLKLKSLHLGITLNLERLHIEECHDLEDLHMPFQSERLTSVYLSHLKLKSLDLKETLNLEMLHIKECHDLEVFLIPEHSLNLRFVNLSHLKLKSLDLRKTPNLEMLDIEDCQDLNVLYIAYEYVKLRSVNIRRLKLNTLVLRKTPNLETLHIEECHDMVELIMHVTCFNLKSLELGHSNLMALDLRQTPNLMRLDLQDCKHLVHLHMPIGGLKRLIFLNLSGCSRIESLLFIKDLKTLKVLSLTRLYVKEFPDIIPEHSNSSLLELRFRYNDIEGLPPSIENLQKLAYLDLHSCRELRSLPGSICGLRLLRNLKLYGCILEELPEDIDRLESLGKLNLSFTCIKLLPESICKLKHLEKLNLSSCWNLEKLPEDIGQLECLQVLNLTECTKIREIPDSICKLTCLKYFSLLDCIQLQKLPEDLGALKCLEILNIKGTRIRHLPASISCLKYLKLYGSKSGVRLHGLEFTNETLETSSSIK